MQLNAGFDLFAGAALASYLERLGVSHLYASPYLQAAPESTHGYDVVDHSRVNDEIGGAAGHDALVKALSDASLGQILDVVPNHMSISGRANRWWWDVLENGPSSKYASYFDVDWDPPEAKLRNLVLMPILGDHYGRIIENGEIELRRDEGSFEVHYHDNFLPVAPRSLDTLLTRAAKATGSRELMELADGFAALPLSTATDAESVRTRHLDKETLRERLGGLLAFEKSLAQAVDAEIAAINASAEELDVLLDRQNYRLARWQTASQELDYRRFFDINTLVALRVEDPRVFQETHDLILVWLKEGKLDGVRIDHIDGLREPRQYLEALREADHDAWLVVEKILEPREALPSDWPVEGTTGYDFLNQLNGLFIDATSEAILTEAYGAFTGESVDFSEVARQKKRTIMSTSLASELRRLDGLFVDVCEGHRRYRDFTRAEVAEALRETIALMPVYRTYCEPALGKVSDADRRTITETVAQTAMLDPQIDGDLLGFLREVLTLEIQGDREAEFVLRFQQVTGPVMAKGVEDTAFYCFNRFVSLNEVGGSPDVFGTEPAALHGYLQRIQERWPSAMLSTSTHDTKRSEDVRARLNVISEIPERWREAVFGWGRMNARFKRNGMPDPNAEYLLYQTLVGAFPLTPDRASQYMSKASKEAKVHTSWTEPNEAYDDALEFFVQGVMQDVEFQSDLAEFAEMLIEPGRKNSLAQTLVKLTSPGVPDIYQGNELWDLSLVDPDNRRPVDFEARVALLEEARSLGADEAWRRSEDGLAKMFLTQSVLGLRRDAAALFSPDSPYEPIDGRGEHAAKLFAFLRGGRALTCVPRLASFLTEWGDTMLPLPKGRWRCHLSGNEFTGSAAASELFRSFPVALLIEGA